MRLFTYVIDHDLGFAPNPFHGVCSLAACKPRIRLFAQLGDYVIGTGSAPNRLDGRLSYWMRIDEIVDFDRYWSDPRFRRRRPVMNGSLMQRHGDNIYHRDVDGSWIQADSFHSEADGSPSLPNLKRDTGSTSRVLLGRDYAYWGKDGPSVPDRFSQFVHSTQGHKVRFPPPEVETFVAWLRSMPERGLIGRPANWPE